MENSGQARPGLRMAQDRRIMKSCPRHNGAGLSWPLAKDVVACENLTVGKSERHMGMRKLLGTRRDRFLSGLIITCSLLTSCSLQARLPTVSDGAVELLVRKEAAQIIAVSEDSEQFSDYQIFLSDFPRKDILGMSIGHRRIYVSYDLAKLAVKRSFHLWLLRQTLAHEIAHETAGHARQTGSTSLNRGVLRGAVSSTDVGLPWSIRFRNYSTDKELDADANGLRYWKMLGWDCRIWVRILQNFERQNYTGDVFHPTDKRLQQAKDACLTPAGQGTAVQVVEGARSLRAD
jgi:predicted Zn-dependent protease